MSVTYTAVLFLVSAVVVQGNVSTTPNACKCEGKLANITVCGTDGFSYINICILKEAQKTDPSLGRRWLGSCDTTQKPEKCAQKKSVESEDFTEADFAGRKSAEDIVNMLGVEHAAFGQEHLKRCLWSATRPSNGGLGGFGGFGGFGRPSWGRPQNGGGRPSRPSVSGSGSGGAAQGGGAAGGGPAGSGGATVGGAGAAGSGGAAAGGAAVGGGIVGGSSAVQGGGSAVQGGVGIVVSGGGATSNSAQGSGGQGSWSTWVTGNSAAGGSGNIAQGGIAGGVQGGNGGSGSSSWSAISTNGAQGSSAGSGVIGGIDGSGTSSVSGVWVWNVTGINGDSVVTGANGSSSVSTWQTNITEAENFNSVQTADSQVNAGPVPIGSWAASSVAQEQPKPSIDLSIASIPSKIISAISSSLFTHADAPVVVSASDAGQPVKPDSSKPVPTKESDPSPSAPIISQSSKPAPKPVASQKPVKPASNHLPGLVQFNGGHVAHLDPSTHANRPGGKKPASRPFPNVRAAISTATEDYHGPQPNGEVCMISKSGKTNVKNMKAAHCLIASSDDTSLGVRCLGKCEECAVNPGCPSTTL